MNYGRRAFTLVELLVVIAIIGILLAILLPALEKSNERARITACSANLHAIGIGLATYAGENGGQMAQGPVVASAVDTGRNWNTIGNNLLWISALGRYNGAGVLFATGSVSDPRVFVCTSDSDKGLKNGIRAQLGGSADVYGSYVYRQLDQRSEGRLMGDAKNTLGYAARAVAFDWQAEGPVPYAHDSHDGGEYLNVLYADGHIQFFANDGLVFGAKAGDFGGMPGTYLHRLSQDWVMADWVEGNAVGTGPKLP